MATNNVIPGITAMEFGDGAGGKLALTIQTRVMKILQGDFQYSRMVATVKNPSSISTGSVIYYKPEIIQTDDYKTGTNAYDQPQAGNIRIDLDTRRDARYTYEEFDFARMGGIEEIISQVATGLANAIQASLNAVFLSTLVKFCSETNKNNNIVVTELFSDDPRTITTKQGRDALNVLKFKAIELGQLYTKDKLGVKYSEMITILSPKAKTILSNAFWESGGSLATEIVLNGLKVNKIDMLNVVVENMLGIQINAGSSFDKDKTLNTTNFAGFMVHNEAVAFPINFMKLHIMQSPTNGNPLFLYKYQFGIDIIRPELVWGICKTQPVRTKEEIKQEKGR